MGTGDRQLSRNRRWSGVVVWQTHQAHLAATAREAGELFGLARLLTHLREVAHEARAEKTRTERWPHGHPAEPSTRYRELADALHKFPLEAVHGEVSFDALLNARRAAREMQPLVGPEVELDAKTNTFVKYIDMLDKQILLLHVEAKRLMGGEPTSHLFTIDRKN